MGSSSKMADGNTDEVKGQFMFCTLCRFNHDQGRKHIYSRKHKALLEKTLLKFGKKVWDIPITISSTTLRSQSLEFFYWLYRVIATNVMIGGFSGEDIKWLAHVTVWMQVFDYGQLSNYTVQFQLCRSIRANFSSLCTNHIWENCQCYNYYCYDYKISCCT